MTKDLKAALRARIVKGAGELVPGAFDALSARIIELGGFSAVYVTGAGFANSYLGAPDIGLTTLTEIADNVRAMRDSCSLPLIVDADTGFGNAVNTYRTVRILERSGADAIQLEDQEFPKRCGHFSGKSVISPIDMCNKIKAAVDARMDEGLLVIARTDAIACNGVEDALERARAYIAAGADMTFVEAPLERRDLERIPAELDVPQIVNIVSGGLTPMLDAKTYAKMGFGMILYANAALQASILAVRNIMQHLKSLGSLEGADGLLIEFHERQRIVGKAAYDELERRYS